MTQASTEQPEAEKLARIYEGGCDIDKRVAVELRRLHARVQELEAAQAQRAPLSDRQIESACLSFRHDYGLLTIECQRLLKQEARLWEKAFNKEHGITQEKQG